MSASTKGHLFATKLVGAASTTPVPKVSTLEALIALCFRWLGTDTSLKPLPEDDPKEPKAARDARRKCGGELFRLIGSMPIDPTPGAEEAEKARKDRDLHFRHLVETGVTESRECSDKFGHLVVLLKQVLDSVEDSESLLAIAIETCENWRDRTDAVREAMQGDLATLTEARS